MSKKEINPPAFPVVGCTITDDYLQEGMSLRDYFAAKAMQGELSSQDFENCNWANEEDLSQRAYLIADAMLKERQK